MINLGKVDFAVSTQSASNAREVASTAATNQPAPEKTKDITVTLSLAGLRQSGAEKTSNDDIEDSGLPPIIKQMLKTIREMRKQLAEKKEELAQLMANKSLDEAQKMAQADALKSAIQTLGSALENAQTNLMKAAKDQKLSAEQSAKMTSLLMR